MTSELFFKSCFLFVVLFGLGTLLCLRLYHWQYRRFFATPLWTKILWWLPIFAIFEAVLFGGKAFSAGVVGCLCVLAISEYRRQRAKRQKIALIYTVLCLLCLAHLPAYFNAFTTGLTVQTLTLICFASVLSDVFAYFLGTYLGKHKLPAWINNRKAWEGVAGQIIGGFIGYLLVRYFLDIELTWWLSVSVGIASAIGDLANSAVKRRLNIKDWGSTIPGHGGVLDRFSSLSIALASSFWIIRILN